MVIEKEIDLFSLPAEDYYFVQCVSSDFKMGKGIALQFNKHFDCKKAMSKSYGSYKWTGKGDCLLPKNHKVFHLITKNRYWDKPTYRTMKESLFQLKEFCSELNIKKIAMPQIGCGLDNLIWEKVKKILIELFENEDIEVIVCIWKGE